MHRGGHELAHGRDYERIALRVEQDERSALDAVVDERVVLIPAAVDLLHVAGHHAAEAQIADVLVSIGPPERGKRRYDRVVVVWHRCAVQAVGKLLFDVNQTIRIYICLVFIELEIQL